MNDVEVAQTGATVAPAQTTAPEQEQVQAIASETTTEQVDTTQEDQPRDDKGRFVQKRINELTRNWRSAERERDFYRQQFEAAQKVQPASAPQSDKPPTLADYNFDSDAWAAAHEQYVSKRVESIAERKFREQESQRNTQQAQQEFDRRADVFVKEHPDFHEAISSLGSTVQFSPQIVEAIAYSEHGPAVAYHLANHLDEADRIARLPAHLAALQLGRIEALVSAPKPKPVTRAPDPAPVVGGGSTASKDPERLSIEEWMAWRQSKR